MGQLRSNQINPKQWKEVFENQTYVMNLVDGGNLVCNGCGERILYHHRVTRLLTSNGEEYYHADKCLKGVELISANIT